MRCLSHGEAGGQAAASHPSQLMQPALLASWHRWQVLPFHGPHCLRSAPGMTQTQTPPPPRSPLRSPPEDDACKVYISENYPLLGGTPGDGSDGSLPKTATESGRRPEGLPSTGSGPDDTLPSKASGRASEASGKLQLP